ncbi:MULTISPECIES: DEAD/DEAH box helicase family protein [unclassified Aminobacter]|uniref:DEAD/DEAH box helicase n=1 Tax=unclassified Aminobacter TaxID=2644704 RepID=UPI000463790B|nr:MULTISPECIES: DEAD/DEAH box helicase family protein [unclassified Aminobacter]TWH36257.1 superfamily II DNA or RNA helicase [Aminobacter sp. J15]
MELRDWQSKALRKAINWLVEKGSDRHFLINAAPGAGKTIAACAIAEELLRRRLIDRVFVIAPRVEVVRQWASDYQLVTGRHMSKITSADADDIDVDVCATWNAIQNLADGFHAVCQRERVLVICDEHHHAAVEAAWGSSADAAFAGAKFVLILTGTPVRSDGKNSIWLPRRHGKIEHPEEGTYTLTYGEAVDLHYCRPATFHRHEGKFTVDLEDGSSAKISSKEPADLPREFKRIPGLQKALDFYVLACTPQYESDGSPKLDGYQGTMVQWASSKLDDLRERMPNAGGLVIAPSIEVAEYFVDLIEAMEGERPAIVHSNLPHDGRIERFRATDRRWIVSVGMISEGVDIPRLRVLVLLPKAQTELAFRQALGRVVRNYGPGDDTRAYVVMPAFQIFEEYARRVEGEMSALAREDKQPTTRRCPSCTSEVDRGAKECQVCGYEFPAPVQRLRTCDECGLQTPARSSTCQHCGHKFGNDYVISLNEALRVGAIVRGIDVDEEEVRDGEAIAGDVREFVLRTGDAQMLKLTKLVPDELWGRLASFMEARRKGDGGDASDKDS